MTFLIFSCEQTTVSYSTSFVQVLSKGQCHEKSVALHHRRCCFRPKNWSANWLYILMILQKRAIKSPRCNASLSMRVKTYTSPHIKTPPPLSGHRFGTPHANPSCYRSRDLNLASVRAMRWCSNVRWHDGLEHVKLVYKCSDLKPFKCRYPSYLS